MKFKNYKLNFTRNLNIINIYKRY